MSTPTTSAASDEAKIIDLADDIILTQLTPTERLGKEYQLRRLLEARRRATAIREYVEQLAPGQCENPEDVVDAEYHAEHPPMPCLQPGLHPDKCVEHRAGSLSIRGDETVCGECSHLDCHSTHETEAPLVPKADETAHHRMTCSCNRCMLG